MEDEQHQPWRVLEFYSGIGGMGNIQMLTAADLDRYRANVWLLSPSYQPYTRQGLQKQSADARASSFLTILENIPQLTQPPVMVFVENVVGFEAKRKPSSFCKPELMDSLFVCQNHYLTAKQVSNLHSFPKEFDFSEHVTLRQRKKHLTKSPKTKMQTRFRPSIPNVTKHHISSFSSKTEKPVLQDPIRSKTHLSESQISPKNDPNSKNPNLKNPLNSNAEKSFSKNPLLSKNHVSELLIYYKNDPYLALQHFISASKKGVVLDNEFSEPFIVLVHILMCRDSYYGTAKDLISKRVFGFSDNGSGDIVAEILSTAKIFDFGHDLSSRVVNYLLCSLVRSGRFNDAIVCFRRMVENNVVPCVPYVHVLLKELVRNSRIAEARDVFGNVLRLGIPYDCAVIRVMIRACLKEGKIDEAEKYFWDAKANGMKLDAMTYSTAIYAVCKKPDAISACGLLNEMKDKGWVPSNGTYTNVIGACMKQKCLTEALRLKDEMISSGVRLNVVAATSLMKGYCVKGDLYSALDLFEKIVEDGVCPNRVTYSVLIEGCFNNGDTKKGFELYTRMKNEGINPNVYNVNTLIIRFFESGYIDEAMKLFDEAVETGIANVFTYNNIISCLCKLDKVKEASDVFDVALDLFNTMQEKGYKPNVITYSILIDGYFRKGKSEEALGIFDQMVDLGFIPSDYTFNIVINGLCKVGQTSEASNMFKKVVEKGFNPTCMTYNSIIDGFVKEGNINSALSVYTEMHEAGITPNVVTYTSLIHGFCKCKNMDLALKMRNEMKRKGLELDVTAYNALINGFRKIRDMGSARDIFNEIYEVGLSPNNAVYNSMISGFRDLDNIEEAVDFHKKMVNEGMLCDLRTYTTLIDGLLKSGKIVSASDLYTEMLAKNIVPDVFTYTVLVNGLCHKGIPGIKDSLLQEFGVRLVSYDLPGFGESDPHPGRNLESSAMDLLFLSYAMHITDKFWVVGYSGGSMHTWAALKYIPDRIAGAFMVAPLLNPYEPSMNKAEIRRTWDKWMSKRRLIFLSGNLDQIDKWLGMSLGKRDNIFIEELRYQEFWKRDLGESVSSRGFSISDLNVQKKRQGKGIMFWLKSIYKRPQDKLTGFLGPIHIWQGMEDRVVPLSMSDYVHQILPGAMVHKLLYEGHFTYFYFCDECHRQIFTTVFGNPQGTLPIKVDPVIPMKEETKDDKVDPLIPTLTWNIEDLIPPSERFIYNFNSKDERENGGCFLVVFQVDSGWVPDWITHAYLECHLWRIAMKIYHKECIKLAPTLAFFYLKFAKNLGELERLLLHDCKFITNHVKTCKYQVLERKNANGEKMSVDHLSELARVAPNRLHSGVNNGSMLTNFEKSVNEQARSNDLKALEISLSMKKMRLKEAQIAVNCDSNYLERFKLSMGISKANCDSNYLERFKLSLGIG
ncbi:pentatricopeptide repeat (PPR) superfamily protein [Artemisia annua]|uniref:Pentatricopeptide repeat (PPR) superfamily protein n=1 Tax=Artemisia annua TaxID=35608 RepID=A0A2U1N982_ARTAN|nr:pentatricopeptide repeat (PPR) superfamily protein [Artemisia annua]